MHVLVYRHFSERMRPDVLHALDVVRRQFPLVTFEVDVDPLFKARKRKPEEPPPLLAVIATVPDEDPPDLSLAMYLFTVVHDRFHWREHARELRDVLDVVNRACFEAAHDRDYLLMEASKTEWEIERVGEHIEGITASIKDVLAAAKRGDVARLQEIAAELGAPAVLLEPVDVVGDPSVVGLVTPGVVVPSGEDETPNDGRDQR